MGRYSTLPNVLIDLENQTLSKTNSIDVNGLDAATSLVYDLLRHQLYKGPNPTIYTDSEKSKSLQNMLVKSGIPFYENESLVTSMGPLNSNQKNEDFDFLGNMYKSQVDALVIDIKNIYAPLVNGSSVADILQDSNNEVPSIHYDLLSLLTFEEGDFDKAISLIEEASLVYDPQFEQEPNFMSKNLQLNVDLDSLNDVNSITQEIEKNLKNLNLLKTKYLQALMLLEQDMALKSAETYDQLSNSVNDFNHKYLTFISIYGDSQPAKPTLLRIISKSKAHYKSYEVLIDNCNDLIREFVNFDSNLDFPATNDLRGVKLNLEFCKSILRGWNAYFQFELSNRFKRANPLNTEVIEIKNVHEELQAIIASINSKSFFAKPIESNSKSTSKQFDFVVDLINKLSNLLKDLQAMPNYFNWLKINNALSDNTRKILTVLKTYPPIEWESIFKENYTRTLVKSKIHPGIIKNDKSLNEILDLYRRSLDSRKNEYLEAFNKHKAGKGGGLFSSTKNQIFSPIYIKTLDKLDEVDKSINGIIWSNNLQDLDKGYEKFENYTLIHQVEEIGPDTYDVCTHFYEAKIDDISITERIKSAQVLAKALSSITPEARIFHHKNASIISFGSQTLNEKIKSNIPKIKEFEHKLNNSDRLVENILETSRRQYLILRDGLVFPQDTDSFVWQLFVIDHFRKAGFTILNEWSLDYYNQQSEVLSSLEKHILQGQDTQADV